MSTLALTLNVSDINDEINQYIKDHMLEFSARPEEILCAYLNHNLHIHEILDDPQHKPMLDKINYELSSRLHYIAGIYLSHVTHARWLPDMFDIIYVEYDLEVQNLY